MFDPESGQQFITASSCKARNFLNPFQEPLGTSELRTSIKNTYLTVI